MLACSASYYAPPLAAFYIDSSGSSGGSTVISVDNVPPDTWTGRAYNVGLYKGNDLIVVKENLIVGNHAPFQLSDQLLFGVAVHDANLTQGQVFSVSSAISTTMYPVNLTDYPNGVIVTLSQVPGSGEYKFIVRAIQVFLPTPEDSGKS